MEFSARHNKALIGQSAAHQMEQAYQAQLNSAYIDQMSLRLENDGGAVSTPVSSLTDSIALNPHHLTQLTQTIPSAIVYPRVAGSIAGVNQQTRGTQPRLYETNTGVVDILGASPGMMQNRNITCGLTDLHPSILSGHNPIMNNSLHMRLSCHNCGRWNFSNHVELLVHENVCPPNSPNTISSQHILNNETLYTDQSFRRPVPRDIVSSRNVPPAEEIVRKLTHVSSSLPMKSITRASGGSCGATPSIQMPNSFDIGISSDKDWSTPLQCFVKRYCVDFITVSASKIVNSASTDTQHRIHTERVGIHCPYCYRTEDDVLSEARSRVRMNEGRLYFPTTIASIYNEVMNLLRCHMHVCEYVPLEITKRYNELAAANMSSDASIQYWIGMASSMGLVDTVHGIQYSNRASILAQNYTHPLEILSSESNIQPTANLPHSCPVIQHIDALPLIIDKPSSSFGDIEGGPLVDPKDKYLTTTFAYALLSQTEACSFRESDRHGKRICLPLGFAGLACRHCNSENNRGRFFPSNIKTMSDTSKTLNVLHSHMLRCQQCPFRVKVGLQNLMLKHDEERCKMKFGSQKAFFIHIWKRLHGNRPFDGGMLSHKKSNP